MGGSNATDISGLRFHISDGEAHAHDDSKGLKFSMASSKFKKEVESAVSQMEKSKQDGMIRIQGKTSSDLCLVKDSGNIFAFLTDKKGIKGKLLTFAKGC